MAIASRSVVNEEKPEVDFRLSVSILPSTHLLGLMHEDTEEEAFEDLLDDSANFIALVDSQATYNAETGVVETRFSIFKYRKF